MANSPFSGSISGVGQTTPCQPCGDFNLTLDGTWTGVVFPERSFDNGTSWKRISADVYGTVISWSANGGWLGFEPETSVLWRLNYNITSGNALYRISQG